MTKKYIEHYDELSKLSQQVVHKHPWGYVGGNIRGGRGAGKTAFALHTGREVYMYLDGISRDDAWEKLLGIGNYSKDGPCVLFDLHDVIRALEPLDTIDFENILDWQKENTSAYKIWDDAGMHGGRYKFFTDVKMVEALQGEVDTIRFLLTGFVTTSPEITSLLSFMREYKDNYVISIKHHQSGGYTRTAEVKRYVETNNRGFRKRLAWKTCFSCYVDKWVYSEYSRMKAHAILRNRGRLKKMIDVAVKQDSRKSPESVALELGVPDDLGVG